MKIVVDLSPVEVKAIKAYLKEVSHDVEPTITVREIQQEIKGIISSNMQAGRLGDILFEMENKESKSVVKKTSVKNNKITIDDIEFYHDGIWCKKIKKGTDGQLLEVQSNIEDLFRVEFTNIEEYQFLTIGLRGYKNDYSNNEKEIICKMINDVFK